MTKKTASFGRALQGGVRRPNEPEVPAAPSQVLELEDSPKRPAAAKKSTHVNVRPEIHQALRIYAATNNTNLKEVADEVLGSFLRQKGYEV